MTRRFDPFHTPMSDVTDLLLVSASAGTGKTWMVTHLAARWLLEQDRHPGELLMVTFSRAAAGELKSRLRARLDEIGVVLEDVGATTAPATEWAEGLAVIASEVGRDEMRRRHRAIMSSLDAVHARTIHSFASSARPVQETDVVAGTVLRRRAVHEVVTRRVTGGDPRFEALLNDMEESSTKKRPGAEVLSLELTRALAAAESAGGMASGRVTLWHDTDGDADTTELVEQLLLEASERLASLRDVEHQVSFDSLIEQLHAEVTSEETGLAERLRAQFGLVVIDEFQDTDALQWEIFDSVFRRGPRATPLIVVGDPKQAIYGFRGGDVTVFQRVQAELRARSAVHEGSYELDLVTNYRSSEGLLGALNGLFLAGDAHLWRFSPDSDADPIRYDALRPGPHLVDQPGVFALRRPDESEVRLFDDVLLVLRQLVDDQRVSPRDIVILCRRRAVVESLRRFLERRGVRTVSSGATSVFLSPAATQLRTLIWVLADVRNPRRARLRAATWFAPLRADELASARAELSRRGVGGLARAVFTSDVLDDLRRSTDGERRITDLEHLCELLGADVPGPVAPERLLHALDAAISDARDEFETNDVAQRRVESDADAITLMTIHASKGLQFPVVLVPDIERGQRRRTGVSSWTTPHGRAIDAATVLGAKATQTHADSAQLDEDRRLIYVALTRAQRVLVAWVDHPDGQWPALVAALDDTALDVGASDTADPGAPRRRPDVQRYGEPLAIPADVSRREVDDDVSRPPTILAMPAFSERPRRWSYSSLVLPANHEGARFEEALTSDDHVYDGGSFAEDPEIDGDDTSAYATVFGHYRGPSLGNAVHEVFERAVGRVDATDVTTLDDLVQRAWTRHGVGAPAPDTTEVVATLLRRGLGELLDERSLDSFVGAHATSAEMRFTLPLSTSGTGGRLAALATIVVEGDPDGPYRTFFDDLAHTTGDDEQLLEGYLTGSLDLVARVGSETSSRFVIVDYKTNLLKEATTYEPSDLVGEMIASGYPLQGLLYSVALHRFLRGRLDGYEPARHLGGLVYYYVRGAARARTALSGLSSWRVPAQVVTDVSDLLDGRAP